MAPFRVLARLLPLAMILQGCARTFMTSGPALRPGAHQLRTILVVVNVADPYLRQDAERRIVERGASRRTRFLASQVILKMDRGYSQEALDSLLEGKHVDGTLVVSLGDSGSNRTDIPATYGTMPCAIYTVETGCQHVPSATPGVTTVAPWAHYTLRLYEAGTGRLVWSAEAQSEGTSYADERTLARSLGDKTVERLAEDRVISP